MFTEEKLNDLIKGGFDKAMKEDKQTFIAFYSFLFNDPDPCTTCGDKLKNYWNKLETSGLNLLNQRKMKADSKFKLRPEITSLQMDFGSSEHFNNETMTDEIALRYLKINPNRIANFETHPENWRELLEDEAKGDEQQKNKKAKN